jgi:hypothetical protein
MWKGPLMPSVDDEKEPRLDGLTKGCRGLSGWAIARRNFAGPVNRQAALRT